MEVREIIQSLYRSYGERDLEKTKSFVSDDFCWDLPIALGNPPYGGRCVGGEAMLDRIKSLDDTFEYLEVALKDFLVEGDQAAVRVVFKLQCRSGGEPFQLNCCHFWQVADGKCVKLTEVYDTGLMSQNMGST